VLLFIYLFIYTPSFMWLKYFFSFNTFNAKLNPIYHLLALLGAHHILHVSRIRVNYVLYIYSYRWACYGLFTIISSFRHVLLFIHLFIVMWCIYLFIFIPLAVLLCIYSLKYRCSFLFIFIHSSNHVLLFIYLYLFL
jgi:hypothetical protein